MKLLSFGEVCWDICGEEKTLGGAPLNLAAHVAIGGGEAYLLSAVGRDALGKEALRRISALGVQTDFVSVVDDLPTGHTIVTVDPSGIPHYHVPSPLSYDRIEFSSLPSEEQTILSFGTVALRSEHNRACLLRLLREHRFSEIYTDLNIRPPFYSRESIDLCLSHATIVKISDEELPLVTQALFGMTVSEEEAITQIKKTYQNIRLLLLTKGSDGAVGYDMENRKTVTVPAVPAKVVSTVGAGDSFGATFLTEYHRSGDLRRAMSRAASVSAFVVSRLDSVPSDMPAFLATLTE